MFKKISFFIVWIFIVYNVYINVDIVYTHVELVYIFTTFSLISKKNHFYQIVGGLAFV